MVSKNSKGEKSATIVKIASTYDDVIKKRKIDSKRFSGWIVESSMSGNILSGYEYKNGEVIHGFDSKNEKKGRISNCITYYVKEQTVYVESCGSNCTSVTVVLTDVAYTHCSGGGSGEGRNTEPGMAVKYSGGDGNVQSIDELDIRIRLTTPCLNNAYNLVNNLSYNNQIKRFLERVFNQNQNPFLVITESPNIPLMQAKHN